jgi:hypothetical protein
MVKWLVNGLIPLGHANLLAGQPGSVKSWLAEYLAVCIITGTKFLGDDGFSVQQGSVIIVDEDTPSDTLDERLKRLTALLGIPLDSLPIKVLSHKGYYFDDKGKMNELRGIIDGMQPPVLVVMDCLSSMMGKLDENKTSDVKKAAAFWNMLKSGGVTLLILHHISLKKTSGFYDYDFAKLVMGNTQIVGSCDTLLAMMRIPPEIPTRSVVRTKARKTTLDVNEPFIVELIEPLDKSWAQLIIDREIYIEPSKAATEIFKLFWEYAEELTVKEICNSAVQDDYSMVEVRDVLHELEKEKVIVKRIEKSKSHQFRYKLNPDLKNNSIPFTSYCKALIASMDIQKSDKTK